MSRQLVFLDLNLRYTENDVPYLSREEIDDIAIGIIRDYNPDLLATPQGLDIDDFTEFYLDIDLRPVLLSNNFCYFGMFVFNDEDEIPIYDAEANIARMLTGISNTILLDNNLYDDNRENLRRFTLAHECGHAILHQRYFNKDNRQMSLFEDDSIPDNVAFTQVETTQSSGRRQLYTDHDWLEYQANSFASSLLMNRPAVLTLLNSIHVGENTIVPFELIAEMEISRTFGVSEEAARIRLKQLIPNTSQLKLQFN